MITVKNKVFTINTANTSYIMHVRDGKYVENVYYGRKIIGSETVKAGDKLAGDAKDLQGELINSLMEKYNNPYGNSIAAKGTDPNITLDNMCLELSNAGTGDYRMLPYCIEDESGCISTRFYFHESLLYEGLYEQRDKTCMPYAKWDKEYNAGSRPWTLELIFRDMRTSDIEEEAKKSDDKDKKADSDFSGLELRQIYTAFEDCDVITRRTVIINKSDNSVRIRSVASMMLDLPDTDYTLMTFDGLWTRERHKREKALESGIYETGSTNGTSSNIHNPFFILRENDANEKHGNCFAFNLIYSGNHRERVEVSEYGKTRIITGMHDHGLNLKLNKGDIFYTPEAVLTFSHMGLNGVSDNCHRFVNEHIVPPFFRKKNRPILINNWEATYFDFNRRKILNLAKEAAELGMELFVLDDGWFGKRNDDASSLGDWVVNESKLGGSLSSLIDDIHKLGLSFGIWVEPEMISEKSALYMKHPDWAVRANGREAYIGRNQMILDYTKVEVRDYIVDALSRLLSENDIAYVKWDMNRPLTDTNSDRPGSFFHEYVLGLYDVIKRITDSFPEVLFEGCSAGGNRFDLGILSYMPQIWTSDDTDPNERMMIQEGTSYGYPQSTMGAHVSAAPNHQTLRNTSLATRFDVAAMGVLGYELDLTVLTGVERKNIKKQIEYYKQHRSLLQFGGFRRVKKKHNTEIWQITSADKEKAICLLYKRMSEPNQSYDILYADNLIEDALYKVSVRETQVSIKSFGNLINQISPVKIKEEGVLQAMISKAYALDGEQEEYVVTGAALMYAGVKLNSRFVGSGLGDGTRVMPDFSSRLYTIEKM